MNGQIYGKVAVVGLRHGRADGALRTRLQATVAGAFDRLLDWQERARGRRMLRSLDDHMLRDIGIDRSVADAEGSAPFWR